MKLKLKRFFSENTYDARLSGTRRKYMNTNTSTDKLGHQLVVIFSLHLFTFSLHLFTSLHPRPQKMKTASERFQTTQLLEKTQLIFNRVTVIKSL